MQQLVPAICGNTNKCVMKKVSVVRSAIFIFNRANTKGDGRRKSINEEAQVYVPVAEMAPVTIHWSANTCRSHVILVRP